MWPSLRRQNNQLSTDFTPTCLYVAANVTRIGPDAFRWSQKYFSISTVTCSNWQRYYLKQIHSLVKGLKNQRLLCGSFIAWIECARLPVWRWIQSVHTLDLSRLFFLPEHTCMMWGSLILNDANAKPHKNIRRRPLVFKRVRSRFACTWNERRAGRWFFILCLASALPSFYRGSNQSASY